MKTGAIGRFAWAALFALAAAGATAQGRSFSAEGSDTIMGVGARHIAMGGTGTATANDPHAVFYNPARLAGIDEMIVSGTRQLDATLRPYTFIGATLPVDLFSEAGLDVTFGVARYNRVHARSSGAFAANEFESIFLRLLLPGISGTFDGDIDSKTLVNRFAVGVRHEAIPGLSIGANVDWIDCKTETCGVHGTSNGYESRSVHATALSFGVGVSYDVSDRLTLAASFSDIATTLDVTTIVTDDLGTRPGGFQATLPRKLNVEAAFAMTDRLLFAAGYQKFWGTYGNYALNFETAHAGVEWARTDNQTWRAGFWAPLELSATNGLSVTPPFPVAPTLGMGWRWGAITADAALYAHPIMTMHRNGLALSADLTVSYRF
jgi:opacity protein-like surface antigen